jgi:hypothetical protein
VLLAACSDSDADDPTVPPPPATVAVYALTTVNGRPLPYTSPMLVSVRTLADTIRLGSDARFTRVLVTDEAAGGGRRDTTRTRLAGAYASTAFGIALSNSPSAYAERPDGALERRTSYGTGAADEVYVYPRVGP